MATYLRRDDWVTDAMGNAISGASVYVCSQPATTTSIPPSPLTQLYADSAGVTPITQPVVTDGYGHAAYYALPGTYTVVYYAPQILETILPDQNIGSGNVAFPVTVPQGGTGATTAGQALINLGAAGRGTNADITSLTAVPNSTIDTTGYQFGTAPFGGGTNLVQIANQSFTGTSYTGYGVGVQSPSGTSMLGAGFIGCSGNISTINLGVTGVASLGSLRVGSTGIGIVNSFTPGQPLQVGALGNPTGPTLIISSGQVTPTTGQGLVKFDANYFTQTTVGAAGGATALPATPRGYLQFTAPDGVVCVFPYYKAT